MEARRICRRFGSRRWALLSSIVALMAALLVTTSAAARGTVRAASTRLTEKDNGTWRLKLTIDYGSVPHLAHMPMVLSFKQIAIYERALTDDSGDKPVETRKPIRNAEPVTVPTDVGFSDVSGKMFRITKFQIKLKHKDKDKSGRFEAGEYELTVRLAAGGKIGGKIRLYLDGKNKIINRRAIEFKAPPPKKKKDNRPGDLGGKPDDGAPKAAEDMGPDLSDIPDDGSDLDMPPPVPPKQGGCGCHVVAAAPRTGAGWFLFALFSGAMLRRRGQRRARG